MTDFKPEKSELEKVRKLAEEIIQKTEKKLPKQEEVKVGFRWTEEPFVLENMSGVSGKSYGSQLFFIDFNTEVSGWKTSLKATAAHEYGHAWFYEQIKAEYAKVLWRYIIDEALTQILETKIVPDYESEKSFRYSIDEIAEYWPQIKQNLGREVKHPDSLFINKGDGEYPNWLGYSLSYRIGNKLLENHELEEFPKLEKSDVIKAGDQLFTE